MIKTAKTVICLALLTVAPSAGAVERVLHNITGYTSTPEGLVAFKTIVFDDDGRIVATGGDELLTEFPDAERLDGLDRYVLPGLHDSHAHVSSQGLLNVELNVTGTQSIQEAVGQDCRLRQSQSRARAGSKVRGWNQVLWPSNAFPDRRSHRCRRAEPAGIPAPRRRPRGLGE